MADTNCIRVMLVDDHAVVRSGLGAFLSVVPDLELVGEAENGEEAVVRCGLLKPDVVLMDLIMPGMDGVAATRLIHQKYPNVHVIALTSFQEGSLIQHALDAGATGYLMKNVSARELAAAIRSAHQGRMTLSPEAAEALIHARAQAKEIDPLTERELEVLRLMVEGLNNAQIAERLVVSLSTVKYHIGNILMKLRVDNRVAAVTVAMQNKLI
ncbi:MAG TPA: response regulator transcription factor [Anaerolineales bacterium]|nr:response regulator transcription factor [Anaerolineales bacterium]